jgi:hypothetical protein
LNFIKDLPVGAEVDNGDRHTEREVISQDPFFFPVGRKGGYK